MTFEVRPDPRLASRRRRVRPIAAMLLLVGLVAGYRWPTSPHLIVLICGIGLGLCWIAIDGPLPIYRCPACRLRLRDPIRPAPGDQGAGPIHYPCPECEIEWETGWRSGGAESGP